MATTTTRPAVTGTSPSTAARTHRRRRATRTLRLVPPNAVEPRVTPYLRWVKPVTERIVAAVLLLLLAPVMLPLAALLLAIPGAPVCTRERRVGRGGEPIDLLRFRTTGPGLGGRTGRLLLRSRLAATPLLLNVLRGDLSIVGPRPEPAEVVAGYDAWEHARHAVRPGLTGLWRVDPRRGGSGRRDAALDAVYVGTVGWRADLSILARTLRHPGRR